MIKKAIILVFLVSLIIFGLIEYLWNWSVVIPIDPDLQSYQKSETNLKAKKVSIPNSKRGFIATKRKKVQIAKKMRKTKNRQRVIVKYNQVDFILISPDPIILSSNEKITLQVFGFKLRNPNDPRPQSETDPLSPKVKRFLKEKYIWLGPVKANWQALRPKKTVEQKYKPSDVVRRYGLILKDTKFTPGGLDGTPNYEVIIDPKNSSKATLLPLSGEGNTDPGVVATLKSNPWISDKNSVEINSLSSNSSEKQSWVKRYRIQPKIKKVFGKYVLFRIKGEKNGKIYGNLSFRKWDNKYKQTIRVASNREIWDKKLFAKAFDLSSHQTFLAKLKATIWRKKRPFSYYKFSLAMRRYSTIEVSGWVYNKKELENELKAEIIEKETPPDPTTKKDPDYKLTKAPDRAQHILESIRKHDSNFSLALTLVVTNKQLGNQLAPEIRTIFDKYRKKSLKDHHYYFLLYTVGMIGVATYEEKQEFADFCRKQGKPLPHKWFNR